MAYKRKPLVKRSAELEFENRLRAEKIVKAINENLPVGCEQLVQIPREYIFRKSVDTIEVTAAIHSCFELIGGLPGIVRWATENPSLFYPLWAKLAHVETSNTGVQINFSSSIPANALDRVSIDTSGNVIEWNQDEEVPE